MSFVSELRKVIEDLALVPENADGVLLTDDQSGMRVQVLDRVPITAIRLGSAGVGHVPRLNLHAGLNLICDYLLVAELNGHTHAVLVELKTTWEPRARDQVRRSLPLLAYLRAVCEVEREAPFDDHTTETGYLIICEGRRLNKQTLRTAPAETVDSEDYRNIRVRTYIGTTVSLEVLTGVSPR